MSSTDCGDGGQTGPLLIRRALRAAQRVLPAAGGTTILAYHLVEASTTSPVDLPLQTFVSQLKQLQGRVGTFKSPGDVVLTFDDAYANFYEVVWPLLLAHKVPAILYVPYDFVEGTGHAPIRGTKHLRACTWAQLREMQRQGLVIGSHTVSHRNLAWLPINEARREIVDSKRMLEDRLGCVVDSFCYPEAKWNRRVERIVRDTYSTAVVGGGTKLRPGQTPLYRIPRVSVRRDMPTDLGRLLRAPVCLEEAIGDVTRRFRR